MTTTTTNEASRPALRDSSPPRLPTPCEDPTNLNSANIKGTDEGFDEGTASEKEGEDSEDEWSETLTFEYMVAHEPFTALPVKYLLFTGWALAPPQFALGIGVDDMHEGYDLAHRLAPNEPVKDSSMLLAVLIHRLRDRTNLMVRATPVRSKEVGFVFYITTSWDDDFTETPAQRDTMNAMLREINWREDIKWYIVGTCADKWREDYNRPVLDRDA
ncbi:uncharacterized protein EV420DRAFT_444249 [Desarmillaria tabescens]|uniref:Uncharacterized protein n=1 Tax=Armillaria tabescens TaxID=1929756 RepID=A0AA39NLW4_ARMTA|nr:uncharacterized protein EV420DRAFT_444249 [Desarmillaria tabescens]KAK0468061.1 hypothetical protein EV420DRAFT_444249 [Desarmillaria tabescens]